MKVFLDTNIVVDLLARRKPFFEAAAKIATLAIEKEIELIVSSISYVTVFYLLRKVESADIVLTRLSKLAAISSISSVDYRAIMQSLISGMNDFEDAVQFYSAISAGADVIITRNLKDFKNLSLPVLSPEEFVVTFSQK